MQKDMRRFKELTRGHTVIMGRKTFESIGKPLAERRNVVITRNSDYEAPEGVIVFHSLEDAIDTLKIEGEELFIIGGSQIYELALPVADRMHLTVINEAYPEADAFFPTYRLEDWNPVHSEFVPQDSKNSAPSTYIIYERKES
jgi:dihydrofolate reductase